MAVAVEAGVRSVGCEDSRRARVLGWLFAVVCVALGSALRIQVALEDPNFDARDASGMLKSDPGLLYYLTQRIEGAGGRAPEDFRADPRIEHPDLTDVPAKFTVGQEFVVAWGHALFAPRVPLHVFCVWIMAIGTSLSAVGAFGLARELTGKTLWAAVAAALFASTPANYRTVGWILMNEDFSVPWLALHLWMLARAFRVRSDASILLASVPLGVAVSTWHAASFFFALEAGCALAWFLRTGRNPLAARHAWILPATLLAFSALVPVLRSTAFALSLPMQVVLALWIAAAWTKRGDRLVAVAAGAILLGFALVWSRVAGGGIGEYGHVFALIGEKLHHLGQKPVDPAELPIEVRLMWQGPFETLRPRTAVRLLGLSGLALVPAALAVLRAFRSGSARAEGEPLVLASTLACASIPVAWLIERTVLLPGLLLPAIAAAAAARLAPRLRPRFVRATLLPLAVLAQGAWCRAQVDRHPIPWYLPAQRQREIAALVREIRAVVPQGEAIAADFMTSTAILAHTGHPIVFQPKWESKRSRERAAELLTTFFHGTPDAMRELLLTKYRCRYAVFDRFTLGILWDSRYAAGIPVSRTQFEPGTCAAVFLDQDPAALVGVPGYRLLYRSPPSIVQSDGSPADFYRLYELLP